MPNLVSIGSIYWYLTCDIAREDRPRESYGPRVTLFLEVFQIHVVLPPASPLQLQTTNESGLLQTRPSALRLGETKAFLNLRLDPRRSPTVAPPPASADTATGLGHVLSGIKIAFKKLLSASKASKSMSFFPPVPSLHLQTRPPF